MAWLDVVRCALVGAVFVYSHVGAALAAPDALSVDAQRALRWATLSADTQAHPFAIVDKKNARIHIFDGAGKLKGTSSVLLGQTPGDVSAPDVGKHTADGFVPLNERTTPSGRFISQPGRNLAGEHVVWVDYKAAFAIHRLRPGAALPARAARLASASAADKRVSLGCVIVPVSFYLTVVQPVMGLEKSVVYVLPESGQLSDLMNPS